MVFNWSSLGHSVIIISSLKRGRQEELYKHPWIPHHRQLYDSIHMCREALFKMLFYH